MTEAIIDNGFTGIHAHVHDQIRRLTGLEEIGGIEIASLIRMTANLYDILGEQQVGGNNISGPRWGLLLRLAAEEDRGNELVTPTYLSRCQSVSKNTISSLLRGLEEQGLVERSLDADDKRIFRIQLTSEGKTLVKQTAPGYARFINELAGELNPSEQDDLRRLLAKLLHSLILTTKMQEAA